MPWGPFEPTILDAEIFLPNLISISIISQNLRTIRPIVTENSFGQNLGGKQKKKKKKWSKNDNSPLRLGDLIIIMNLGVIPQSKIQSLYLTVLSTSFKKSFFAWRFTQRK